MRQVLFYWLPAVAWLGLILGLSSVPAQSLPSGGVAAPLWSAALRYSLAHIAEYAVLGALLLRLLASYRIFNGWMAPLLAFALAVGFGALDEIYQSFIAGRNSMMADVGLDAVGALLGILVWLCAARLMRRVVAN